MALLFCFLADPGVGPAKGQLCSHYQCFLAGTGVGAARPAPLTSEGGLGKRRCTCCFSSWQTLESVRHDLQKGDKKLQKRSVQASKDPTKDLGKVSSRCTAPRARPFS